MTDDTRSEVSRRTEGQRPDALRRPWLQISLSTLLAFVLGIGVGLAVKHQFGECPKKRIGCPIPPAFDGATN